MIRSFVATITAACLLATPGVTQSQEELQKIHAEVIQKFLDSQNTETAAIPILPAELPLLLPVKSAEDLRFEFQFRMGTTGHGVLYDSEGHRVNLGPDEIIALQKEMLEAARADVDSFRAKDPELEKATAQMAEIAALIEDNIGSGGLDEFDQFLLHHFLIRSYALQMQAEFRSLYLWRTDYLVNNLRGLNIAEIKNPRVLRIRDLLEDWVRDFDGVLRITTAYMRDCANEGVPVPPDFALTGTAWTRQGALTINMLQPGNRADLYTWADPNRRGACVALPRYTASGGGGLAGIICQGAQTGKACVWDSKWAGSGARVEWETGVTMPINRLMSRTELPACSDCHLGNNVYLVAPDDAAWCKLLRGGAAGAVCGTMDGANAGNFTLQVEGNVRQVNAGGLQQSRFQWVNPGMAGADWNNQAGAGCGGACHLAGNASFVNRFPPNPPVPNPPVPAPTQQMPPACGTDCN